MHQFTRQFNRPAAEVLANHIADSVSDDVSLTDIIVTATNRGHVIQMEYELNGEPHQRVLRSVNEVESFLNAPLAFTINSSPESVTPDHEMDW